MERLNNNGFISLAWKITGAVLVLISVFAGFSIDIPQLPIVEETVRNVFFHVCMWFAMMAVLLYSVLTSIRFLAGNNLENDRKSLEAVNVGLLFGTLGILTGMLWAQFTWGRFWVNDPKLNGAAVTMLVYLAYIVLRMSVKEDRLRARLAAVYNIFAFVLMVVFIGILPRVADGSLHPGGANDSPFAVARMQGQMYPVFLLALSGWIIMAFWILNLRIRMSRISDYINKNIH